MTGAIEGYTANFNLKKVNFNWVTWHDHEHENWDTIDALLYSVAAVNNIQGVWQNGIGVLLGERYIDNTDGTIWEVLVAHTTAVSGTFEADRTANPSYWLVITPLVPISKGTWANDTLYQKNDYVELTGLVGIALDAHTSSSAPDTIDDDSAHWTFLIDFRTELAQISADAAQTAQDAIDTAADAVATALDAIATASDAVDTAADLTDTNADVVLTHADVVLTGNDVATTNQDAIDTAADATQTALDAIDTAADAVLTAADVVSSGLNVDYAEEWATKAEDSLISVAAGGDGSTDYSALHWAAKALGYVKDFISGTDTPANYTGAGGKTLKVNSTPDGVEFVDMLATASQFTKTQGFTETTLTDGATVNWDLEANQSCKVTWAGNRTMAAPTNHKAGHYYSLRMIQDSTGSRIPIWNAAYHFADQLAPTNSTDGDAEDLIVFVSDGSVLHESGRSMNCG